MSEAHRKRVEVRVSPAFELLVRDARSGEEIGVLADVSLNGARILATSPLEEGARITLELDLPESMGGDPTLRMPALCVWCRRALPDGWHEAGFELQAPLGLEADRSLARLVHIWSV